MNLYTRLRHAHGWIAAQHRQACKRMAATDNIVAVLAISAWCYVLYVVSSAIFSAACHVRAHLAKDQE